EVPVPPGKFQRFMTFAERWTGLLRYAALVVLFALVYLLILRPVKKQVMTMLKAPAAGLIPAAAGASAGGAAGAVGDGAMAALGPGVLIEEPSGEVQQIVALKKQLVTRVKQDPDSAGKLIQNWMRQEKQKK